MCQEQAETIQKCFTCQQVLLDETESFTCEECHETYCKDCWERDLDSSQESSSAICGTCYSYDDGAGCDGYDDFYDFDDDIDW